MYFSFQSEHFFINLFFVGFSFPSFIRPSGMGRPQYLSSKARVPTFRIEATASPSSAEQFCPNIIEHFAGLRSWPVLSS
jgi:hypothetical protein